MKTIVVGVLIFGLVILQSHAQQSAAGDWILTLHDSLGSTVLGRLSLEVSGDKLSGTLVGRPIEGTVRGLAIEFKGGNLFKGALEGADLKGEAVLGGVTVTWTAVRIPPRPASPRIHDFEPKQFHPYLSSRIDPALRVHPGDSVRTWTVDDIGVDKHGKRIAPGGNPQIGPFYVEGALPGDTLVVRLDKVRINRGSATSGRTVVLNALEPGTIGILKWDQGFATRWTLDPVKNIAVLEKPTEALKNLTIPLQPMLGGLAVAPPGASSVSAQESGRFGGNMDYNQIREGTTVYLPVYHPGALLFMGDGHAAQGDGELTGSALETSMDVEFTVDVIRGSSINHPLAETSEFLISIGIGGALDQALQQATSGMMRWLERDYKLTPNESAMLLGFALKYDVVDLVGTQVSIAAKLPKSAVAQLPRATATR